MGFQLIQTLGFLGMYFDAVVVEVETFLLLFRLALAILWVVPPQLFGPSTTSIDPCLASFMIHCLHCKT